MEDASRGRLLSTGLCSYLFTHPSIATVEQKKVNTHDGLGPLRSARDRRRYAIAADAATTAESAEFVAVVLAGRIVMGRERS